MQRQFVVVSGLPASGKTTLALELGSRLHLPVIGKDEILESLFASKGTGDVAWRRLLSRESDQILQEQAIASSGAILVSFWRLPGMDADSGTPIEWISELGARVVNVHCVCQTEIAAERFFRRSRHPGHLDGQRSYPDILASLKKLASFEEVKIGARIEVDTSRPIELEALAREIQIAFRGDAAER